MLKLYIFMSIVDMDSHTYFILTIIILTIAILLNVFGIYILQKQKRRENKQKIILVNLSALDITLGIALLLETVLASVKTTVSLSLIFTEITLALYITYYEFLTFICLDRLACVLLHMKYNYYVTFSRVKKAIAIFWLVGLCSFVPLPIFKSKKIIDLYMKIILPTLDCIFIVISFVTYSVVGLKLKNSNLQFASSTRRKQSQNLIVPFLIILSFTLCFVIPDIILIFMDKLDPNDIVMRLFMLHYYFNLMLDPLIYIFINKKARENALTTLHYSCCTRVISLKK